MFGNKNERLEYLEEERKLLWAKILEIEKNATDYEKEAKEASRQTSGFRNKAQNTKEEAENILKEIRNFKEEIDNKLLETQVQSDKILEAANILENKFEIFTEKINKLEEIFTNHPNLDDEIDDFELNIEKIKETSSKSETAFKNINTKKTEIDDIYFDIVGYVETDEESGKEIPVEGLKDKLEKQYNALDKSLKNLEKFAKDLEKEASSNFANFSKEKNEEYNSIKKRINDLMPAAMTAGLSSAYSEKKTKETENYGSLKVQFYIGIGCLVLVSLIPFAVSIYSILHNVDIYEAINRIPKMVVAILPIYIPVLWLSFYSNKQLNLSKRLIEEYTHKEVLSKTFEGLSSQINNIEENSISNDLRVRLLYNLLQVSSENPGKLISNYKNSDHPIMEVLDQSANLQNLIDNLEKIPGMSKLVKVIESKKDKLIELADKKTDEAMENFVK
jgi:DNA repair exonuclease SbcCD ATPase subunit